MLDFRRGNGTKQEANMIVKEIRKLAKGRGIKIGKLNKTQLIKTIQRQEGNYECFGSAKNGFCDQGECLWMGDCIPAIKSASAKNSIAVE